MCLFILEMKIGKIMILTKNDNFRKRAVALLLCPWVLSCQSKMKRL